MEEKQSADDLTSFNLAPLKSFSLTNLLNSNNEKVMQLIITFSIIHNDIKDLLWFEALIGSNIDRLPPDIITPERGQLNGMHEHCHRLIFACAWEFINAIQHNLDTLKLPSFDCLLNSLSKSEYKIWKSIIDIIANKSGLYKTLQEIRHNATYHYCETEFASVGLNYYKKNHDDNGYISFGKCPEETRFYFADAAIQYYHKHVVEKYTKNFVDEVKLFIRSIFICLHGIVKEYFRQNINTLKTLQQ